MLRSKHLRIGLPAAILAVGFLALGCPSGPQPDPKVTVPDVLGKAQAAAQSAVKNVGLEVGTVTEQFHPAITIGNVISQAPSAGAKVNKGSRVNLVISKGPEPVADVAVPNVTGMGEAAAESALAGVGLTVGAVTEQYSPTVPAGRVVSQVPTAGTRVSTGSSVNLAMSKGPQPVPDVMVPNIVGMTQEDAETEIIGAGLMVGAVSEDYYDTAPVGEVISQSPVAGTSVSPGSLVNLEVSKGPEPVPDVTVPDVVGMALSEAEAVLEDSGLATGTVTHEASDTVPPGHVIEQDPAAGSITLSNTAVALTVAKRAIEDAIDDLSTISGGVELQEVIEEVASRKEEALPLVKEKLQAGDWHEKHMMTRFLQRVTWPETYDELLGLAASEEDEPLGREGALYALGALDDPAAGPAVVSILLDPNSPDTVQLVAIAALARIGYHDGVDAIALFADHEDLQIRIFANRALAELGAEADRDFLLSMLDHEDYLVRELACGALAYVSGEDIAARLQDMADYDPIDAVRAAAGEALLRREMLHQKSADKLRILAHALETAERHTAVWIVWTIVNECGPEGIAFAQELAARDDDIGERARAFLLWRGFPRESLPRPSAAPASVLILPPRLKHADDPTHQTLMDYAVVIAVAEDLLPRNVFLPVGGIEEMRMGQGAVQEDWRLDIVDYVRPRKHAYNPLTNRGFKIDAIEFDTARDWAREIWQDRLRPYFETGYREAEETRLQWGGAWQQLGRVSHLLQDMTAPLHVLSVQHLTPKCKYEAYWGVYDNDRYLWREILHPPSGPALYSDLAELPDEALFGLDPFSKKRLRHWYASTDDKDNGPVGCPNRLKNDVRGYMEVLAWISYFRVTVWGEVWFNRDQGRASGEGPATAPELLEDVEFDDEVPAPKGTKNALHAMFPDRIRWVNGWTDNYFTLESRNNTFHWKKIVGFDHWGACDRGKGLSDGSKVFKGAWHPGGDHDSRRARTVGRFWFDTRRIGANELWPENYPDGTPMDLDLFEYYARTLSPLTVRYNAGLLNLANRRVTVRTSTGTAGGFKWSREDNFGKNGDFATGTAGVHFYFVAKSEVSITAPLENTDGRPFRHWFKGNEKVENRVLTLNKIDAPIPREGLMLTAVYEDIATAPSVTSFAINGGAASTASRTVTLSNTCAGNPTHYMASESSSFIGASWKAYSTAPSFTLSSGSGTKAVYFKVKNATGESSAASDSIELSESPVEPPSMPVPSSPGSSSEPGAVIISTLTPTLVCSSVSGATQYEFVVSSKPYGEANVVWSQVTTGPSATVAAGYLLAGQEYRWNVRAGNSAGWSAYSYRLYFLTSAGSVPEILEYAINMAAGSTTSRTVTLNNTCTGSPTHYMASESSSFTGASWQPYSTSPSFNLSSGNGTKTVYLKVKNATGESSPVSNSIDLNEAGEVINATIKAWSVTPGTVTVGNSVTLSMNFANTGNVTHTFVAGASLWKPNGGVVDFERSLTLSPGQSTTTTWNHTIDAAGSWYGQFAVWKQKPFIADNLLVKAPSPSQHVVTAQAAPPSAPTLLSATPKCNGTSSGIEIVWSAVSGATNYEIWRNGVFYFTTATSGTIFWNVSNITAGQTYTYQVKAKSPSGTSGLSNSRSAVAPYCG